MPYLVEMLAWEVKVEGSRLRHMGERPGTLVFLNGRVRPHFSRQSDTSRYLKAAPVGDAAVLASFTAIT
jgi:hypothetical protein